MKVCIGSAGRFHTFDLARQMERLGHLEQLYTGYPKWKVDGISHNKVSTFPWLMGIKTLLGRMVSPRFEDALNSLTTTTFDDWVARNLAPCEIFHSLSSFGICSHRVAKDRFGSITVCDRGSSHILYQKDILTEEYERWGLTAPEFGQKIVERELEEYEECDLIFAPSNFVFYSFIEKGVPPEKIKLIPYGVDTEMFYPIPKKDNVFRVIYVGALSIRKGIPYLLEAFESLNIPRAELWLVGSLLSEIKPFLKKLEGKFHHFGIIQRKDLYKYYSQASVFVLASLEEGLALVQLQAMACGIPVIATEHTGAENIFLNEQEGFIVPIRNSRAIREKLEFLYEQPEVLNTMSKAALKRIKSYRSWDEYGQAVAKVYQKALKKE